MRRIDVPTALPLAKDTRDVTVENIELVRTTDDGVVRVRNLAFEKWIVVRFTLDKWQTTSEVTARYKESLLNGTMGHLIITIKLGRRCFTRGDDPLSRPTFGFRSRNWNNNSCRNFHVQIVREKVPKANKETVIEKPQESSLAGSAAPTRTGSQA
jgi:hypothetical protein